MYLLVKNAEVPPALDIELLEKLPEHEDETDDWNPCHLMMEVSDEEADFIKKAWATSTGDILIRLIFKAYRQAEEDEAALRSAFSSGAALGLFRGGGTGPAPGTFGRLMRELEGKGEP